MELRVVTWNLFHGRARPPAGRSLQQEFARALAGWEWDVALLQEVPPWWPPALAAACAADHRTALTSRNAGLAARRALAERAPDLMRSSGGGANAILARREIRAHARRRLCLWPERRVVHAVALAGGVWAANVHATAHRPAQARADLAAAREAALAWAGDAPLVLGGDTNLLAPRLAGLERIGGCDVDFVFARGLRAAGPVAVLERGALSDHAPVAVTLAPA